MRHNSIWRIIVFICTNSSSKPFSWQYVLSFGRDNLYRLQRIKQHTYAHHTSMSNKKFQFKDIGENLGIHVLGNQIRQQFLH